VNLGQFQPVAKETAYLAPDFKTRFTVLSHEQQAMAAPGDSGGPLIFQSKGDKVAGIYSRIKIDLCTLPGGDGRLAQMLLMTFEPVKDHLPWIRAVQAGELGKSRVVDLAEEADLPAGAEAAPAASAGTAVEKKAA
jgi:hypothetical protein